MNVTEDVMNKVEVNRDKVHICTELLSNSLTSYIGCNVCYRFVLRNKYYNLEIILNIEGRVCRCGILLT